MQMDGKEPKERDTTYKCVCVYNLHICSDGNNVWLYVLFLDLWLGKNFVTSNNNNVKFHGILSLINNICQEERYSQLE